MEVHFYGHPYEIGLASGLMARELKNKGHNVYDCDCLCTYPDSIELPDVVVSHPAANNSRGCWDKLKRAIESHPDVRFYIFGQQEREKHIGEHTNVVYIKFRNIKQVMRELGLTD